jgi:poly-gamma-glutamate synthesis protein (capsule biosynthesis protein)
VATLTVCGDAMSHMPQTNDAYNSETGEYDYTTSLQYVKPWIEAADYAVANLETTLSGGPDYSGYPSFNSPDALAYALKDAGFDLLSTANNHSLDKRFAGLSRTLDVLDEVGLAHVGTYRTQEEYDANSGIVVADVGGISVAFLSYTYGTNGIPVSEGKEFSINLFNTDYTTTLSTPDTEKIQKEMAAARALGTDLIAVIIHWGVEYQTRQNSYQEQIADLLFNEGADLVLGGHPHVLQPMELRELEDGRTGFVCFSLGNFISAQNQEYTDTTVILNLELTKDPYTGETSVTDVSYVPCLMLNRGSEANPRFLLLDAYQAMEEYQSGTSKYVTGTVYARLEKAVDDCHKILGSDWDYTQPADPPAA